MTVTDVLDIRLLNLQSIVRAIRFSDGITKREIARVTKLSFATVSNLCNELMKQGYLRSVQNNTLSVGRTPQMLTFAYDKYCTIALNLQLKGNLNVAVLNFRNIITAQRSYTVDDTLDGESIIRLAKTYFDRDIKPLIPEDVIYIGIGVAVSSIFDINTSDLICCAIPQLENVNIKDITKREFGIPAYVNNEANLCAYALQTQGEQDNVIYIHASEGVGLGVIIKGELLEGTNGYAGEVAHMPIGCTEHRCRDCGNLGCIERELCIDGILENYYGRRPNSRFAQWKSFLADLQDKNEKATEVALSTGFYLGRLVAVLVNLFDPSVIYIGGEISDLRDILNDTICLNVQKYCGKWRKRFPQVVWDSNSQMQINIGIAERICSKWTPA